MDDQILALPEPIRRRFACTCAEHVLPYYTAQYPQDQRLHVGIEVARGFAVEQASDEQLLAALADVAQARDAAQAAAEVLEKATWDAWRYDPRQKNPPPLSQEDADSLPRDRDWWRGHDAVMNMAGRAAAWLVADGATRQRWAAFHAAWYAAEAAYWAMWLDTAYDPVVLEIAGVAGLADVRYACRAADSAARCPTEAAAMAALATAPVRFLQYYGNAPLHGPASYSTLAAKYGIDMDRARHTVMDEQRAWQQQALETQRVQDTALVRPLCSAAINQALTRLLHSAPLAETATDALRALQALACELDPLALFQASRERTDQAGTGLLQALTDTVTGHLADPAWRARYQSPLTEAFLTALSSIRWECYKTYVQLLCMLGEARVLDTLQCDFIRYSPNPIPGFLPGNLARLVGRSGFAAAPAILEDLLPYCRDDLTRLSVAAAYAECAPGAAAVEFIITRAYPQCSSPRAFDAGRIPNLLLSVRGPGVVEACLTHLAHPHYTVRQKLLLTLQRIYQEQRTPAPPHVLEAVAALLDTADTLFIRDLLRVLQLVGRRDALPYLQAARQRATDKNRQEKIARTIANLQR